MSERTICGSGVLNAENEQIPVSYAITVFPDGAFKSATGHLQGDPKKLLSAMMQRENLVLDLESGGQVNVIITKSNGSANVDIRVSGPVPD